MKVPSWDDNGMGTKVVSTKHIVEFVGNLCLVSSLVCFGMVIVWLSLPEDYTPTPTPLTQEEYVEQMTELQDNVIRLKKELIELQELKILELEGKAYLL